MIVLLQIRAKCANEEFCKLVNTSRRRAATCRAPIMQAAHYHNAITTLSF